jgi:hypothetical protein
MNLVQYQDLPTPLVKFIGKRKNSSPGKIKIVQVHIKTVTRIAISLPDEIKKEGSLSHTTESLDTNYPGIPVNFMVKFPGNPYIAGADQKFM